MDLSTTYLGMNLPHPMMAGASPLSDEMDTVRQLEDAGSAAIVLRSLFEEQMVQEQMADMLYLDANSESFAEATNYFPDAGLFVFGADEYLNHLRQVKEAVRIPVIASLNGSTPGGWLDICDPSACTIAQSLCQAGAAGNVICLVHRTAPEQDRIRVMTTGLVRD